MFKSVRLAAAIVATLSVGFVNGCAPVDEAVDTESTADEVKGRDGKDHWFVPSAASLSDAQAKVARHNDAINNAPNRRADHGPYAMFHQAGKPIRGAVLLFHGFSSRPHQMSVLAQYLFDNGYDVYLPNLYGQGFADPKASWAQTKLKPAFQVAVTKKLDEEGLGALIRNDPNRKQSDDGGLIMKLSFVANNPLNGDVAGALKAAGDYDDETRFQKFMDSNHGMYLTDAKERLAEIEGLAGPETNAAGGAATPGVKKIPIFTLGLSVGGAVALGLGEARKDRLSGVVAYAPLLRQFSKTTFPFAVEEFFVNGVGPLGTYNFSGWGPTFPMAAFTASNRFGSEVRERVRDMTDLPAFIVSTENEDGADNKAQSDFYDALGGARNNYWYTYKANRKVPHPMVHPAQVSQGMQNTAWKTLYRETLRFLVNGNVDKAELDKAEPSRESASRPGAITAGSPEAYPPVNAAP